MADRSMWIPAAVAGALVAGGLAVGGWAIGLGVINARVGDRAVTVRGLSEREVKADLAVLPLKFTATGEELTAVQTAVDAEAATVTRFLLAQGFKAAEIDLGRLTVSDARSKEYGQQNNGAPRFILSQEINVRTADVERVQETTRKLGDLVRQAVVLQDFGGPNYIFTKLNGVRPTMIAEATASARTGAAQFARDSGAALGGIQEATQGSFEILPRDDMGEGGSQSQSVWKKLRVVTTVKYRLR